jgi:hypothetical protein
VKWIAYKRGYLAQCKSGYFFVHKKFDYEKGEDRWFAEYEAGVGEYGEKGSPLPPPHGFTSLEEARTNCEKLAIKYDSALGA